MNRKLKRYIDSIIHRRVDAFFRDNFLRNILEKIKKKVLNVTPESIYLKKVSQRREDFGPDGYVDMLSYRIMAKNKVKDIPIGSVDVWNSSNGVRYVANLEIKPMFRGAGLGTELLKKNFSGHYIVAGNPRVKSLYERLGKPLSKFSNKEHKELNEAFSGYGTWKLY